jgi:hypothetical protein
MALSAWMMIKWNLAVAGITSSLLLLVPSNTICNEILPHIAAITPASAVPLPESAFRHALRERRYVEGQGTHFHCCVIDGVFAAETGRSTSPRPAALTPEGFVAEQQ